MTGTTDPLDSERGQDDDRPHDDLDVLKYVRSHVLWQLNQMILELEGLGETEHPLYRPLHGLRQEVAAVTNSVPVGDIAEWNRYSHGRPVMSELELEPGRWFFHSWRPDPATNDAHIAPGRLADGSEVLVAITPPQTLELVKLDTTDTDPLDHPERQESDRDQSR